MPLADYAHHNEDAYHIWWEEEGRHEAAPPEESYWEHETWEDVPDEECTNAPQECMEYGNYNHEHDGIWSCSSCGTLFHIQKEPYVVTPVLEGSADRLTIGECVDLFERHGVVTIYTPSAPPWEPPSNPERAHFEGYGE